MWPVAAVVEKERRGRPKQNNFVQHIQHISRWSSMSSISLISNLHARNTRGRMLESFKVQQIKTNAISKSSTYFNSKSTNVHLSRHGLSNRDMMVTTLGSSCFPSPNWLTAQSWMLATVHLLWALLVRLARSRKTRSELAAVDVMAHVVLCCYSPVAPMTNS